VKLGDRIVGYGASAVSVTIQLGWDNFGGHLTTVHDNYFDLTLNLVAENSVISFTCIWNPVHSLVPTQKRYVTHGDM
jgi:hypothetical protein